MSASTGAPPLAGLAGARDALSRERDARADGGAAGGARPGRAVDRQTHRVGDGRVDRSRTLSFAFDGRRLEGHPGDTLASALLANGQRLVGRSFKYHRPRGIFSMGVEEPNALVGVGRGARHEPNVRATVAELYRGLVATSQNRRGSLRHDLMAVNDLAAPLLAAGFYYKTFMWPKAFWEKVYEPAIRASAGLGRLSGQPDPDAYGKGFLFADVLVIGAGPAGLAAALAAGRAGARTILCDEDFLPGGRLNAETHAVDGVAGHAWAANAIAELRALDNVRVMTRTSVFGAYDHGTYGALERVTDHLPPDPARGAVRQILWRVRATRTVLAAGATERHVAFPDNDRPGVMLAGAVRGYLNRFGVAPGRRVSLFTSDDDGWRTAIDLAAAGVEVVAVVDARDVPPPVDAGALGGARLVRGGAVVGTRGRHALTAIRLGSGLEIPTDCLAVSGGWNPNVHLSCHQRGRPAWRDDIAAFVPGGALPAGMDVAGAADGELSLGAALGSGHRAAVRALEFLDGLLPGDAGDAPVADDEPSGVEAYWQVPARATGPLRAWSRAWIDFQNDVTTKDVALSVQEGFRASEHVKRYTTLGMATDQGKTSNVLGLGVLAEATGRTVPETGTTIFRPPWTPVPIAAFAGASRGAAFRPTRLTPSHAWAAERGATFVETGAWLRAQWFARDGERTWRETVDREVRAVRSGVGVCDVTTLGKIDVQGADAGAFLDRAYANTFSTLAVGRVRYGLMLREDGFAMDDGTAARLDEHRYVVTTTTANAGSVFRHLEFCRQCLWPELDVHLVSTTDAWAQYAVAGPRARDLVALAADELDVSDEEFPFMACAETTVCGGTPARLFRISFSGELAYELAVPARFGDALMRFLMAAGEPLGVTPYGTEALGVMRVEKGHAAGNELNGQTTARDLGLGRMVSDRKDCVGNALSRRPGLVDPARPRLVGFVPVDPTARLRAGAHFVAPGAAVTTANDEGWMSSVAFSPTLGHSIGLGFLARGAERAGEIVRACDPLRGEEHEVRVVSPHFVDPDGTRPKDASPVSGTSLSAAAKALVPLAAKGVLDAPTAAVGGCRIAELSDASLVSIAFAPSRRESVDGALASALGVGLPVVGRAATGGDGTRLLGLQRDQLWCAFEHVEGPADVALAERLGGDPHGLRLTDQGDGWTRLRLDGDATLATLERLCPLDLAIDAFPIGAVARTVVEHLGVVVLRTGEAAFELYTPRSSAGSFVHALSAVAAQVAAERGPVAA